MIKSMMKQHEATICPNRPVSCSICSVVTTSSKFAKHNQMNLVEHINHIYQSTIGLDARLNVTSVDITAGLESVSERQVEVERSNTDAHNQLELIRQLNTEHTLKLNRLEDRIEILEQMTLDGLFRWSIPEFSKIYQGRLSLVHLS